jgi:thiamine biosynthesis lipoprotein
MKQQKLFEHTFQALGGTNEVKLFAADGEHAAVVFDAITAEVLRIQKKYSRYDSESVVSQINTAAGELPVLVDDETASLLNYADICFKESSGLFDITSGVLRRVWDFQSGELPTQDAIEAILPLVGWSRAEWAMPYFGLPYFGMEIDFGGIGKEYAVDRCAQILKERNDGHALINFSGDLFATGPRVDGTPWSVGVQDPRNPGASIAHIHLCSGALATSGDYERFMMIDGERYCHILNPKTGWPVKGLQSVSVNAPSCLAAGSVATIAMLFGEKRGARFLKESGAINLVVTKDGRLISSAKGRSKRPRPLQGGRALQRIATQ